MLELRINGALHEVDPPVGRTLAETLRDELGLTGTKIACGEGHCGACTVQLDGVPMLSCITLVHTVGEREVTTIEGLRDHPLVDAFVRADALQCGFCTPGQIVSAAALVEAEPESDPRARPPRDGRQPLPLRRVPANRGGSADVARLIRTEKEVEGRYTEQWVVVEGDDDALDQWPQGPRDVVGRPAPRQDGHQRARGQAIFTADLQLPGLLHTAVLRVASCARARRRLDFSRAREAPGRARGAIGPDDCHVLQTEPPFHGSPVAAVAADSYERAREALALVEVEWEELEPLLDPEQAVREKSFVDEPRTLRARRRRRGLRRGRRDRRGRVPHADRPAQRDRDPPVGRRWEGDTLEVYISTQFIWGVRDSVSEQLGLPPDRVRVVCNYMGGGFGAKNGPGDHTYIAIALAGKTGRPVHCALTAARGEPGRRQPQRDDPEAPRRRALGRDARRARRRVRERDRLGRVQRPDLRADRDALRLRERPHADLRRRS